MSRLAAQGSDSAFFNAFWRFFSSVRLAIVLIFLIAAAGLLGTLIQQEGMYPSTLPPELYYPAEYGTYGDIMFTLGLTRMYSSWWFLTLLVLIGINLIVCSIDRFVPLIKALHHPKVVRSQRFIKGRHVYAQLSTDLPPEAALQRIARQFKKERYAFSQQQPKTGVFHAYADKGRWGRYGPYVTHIGLLAILLAALGMFLPGWYHDEFFWVAEGESVRVPHTDFVVRNDGFTVEFYDDGRPKHFQTNAVIIDDGQETHRHAIEVNKPLIYNRVNLLQASYQFELGDIELELKRRAGGASLGRFTVDLQNPARTYNLDSGVHIRLVNYFPEFAVDPREGPITLSSDPLNPAFVLEIKEADLEPVYQIVLIANPNLMLPGMETSYVMEPTAVNIVTRSGLVSHKNLALPYIYAGLIVTVLGVFLSFYLYHRRVWIRVADGCIDIGAMSNKHPLSLDKELTRLVNELQTALEADVIVAPQRLPSTLASQQASV